MRPEGVVELPAIQFAIHTPTTDDKAHIQHALSLGLPESDTGGKTLHIVANGPSARQALIPPNAETMACNGALRLFTHRAPTYWICCDPQGAGDADLTPIDFLKGPLPEETIYLVASKCHPEIFERVADYDVRLWHVNDHEIPGVRKIPCAVSVTLCALMWAHRQNYRDLHVWGWDCCFQGDAHHAGDGDLSATPDVLDIEVGEGEDALWFKSTSTWCCEVEDARKILPVLKWAGTDVTIHGPSMLAAILKEYADA